MSLAQHLADNARTIESIQQVYSIPSVCEILYDKVLTNLRSNKCIWYNNYSYVSVEVVMFRKSLPEDFWVFSNEYGIVMHQSAFTTMSEMFRKDGFNILTCSHAAPGAEEFITFRLQVVPLAQQPVPVHVETTSDATVQDPSS